MSGHKYDMFACEQLLNVCAACRVHDSATGGPVAPSQAASPSARPERRQVTLQPVKSAARKTSESNNWLHRAIKGREIG